MHLLASQREHNNPTEVEMHREQNYIFHIQSNLVEGKDYVILLFIVCR